MSRQASFAIAPPSARLALAAVCEGVAGGLERGRCTLTPPAAQTGGEARIAIFTAVTKSSSDSRSTVTHTTTIVTRRRPTLVALALSAVLGSDCISIKAWRASLTVCAGGVPPAVETLACHVVTLVKDQVGIRVAIAVALLARVAHPHRVTMVTWRTPFTIVSSITRLAHTANTGSPLVTVLRKIVGRGGQGASAGPTQVTSIRGDL